MTSQLDNKTQNLNSDLKHKKEGDFSELYDLTQMKIHHSKDPINMEISTSNKLLVFITIALLGIFVFFSIEDCAIKSIFNECVF